MRETAALRTFAATAVQNRAAQALLPLEVRGLTLKLESKMLIDGLDLKIDGDGITMVMGPNGAGKSILLRLLHGLIKPTAGEVLWAGRPPAKDVRWRQALVFQKPVLLRRSVAANIDFVLSSRNSYSAERRAELLGRVGLADKAGQPARLLSGGEQQRLALARALANDPEVLLLDEPTASLDPASAHVIETIVSEAAGRGTRVIFVTHDVGQAKRLARDVVFLNRGRVVEHTPASRFFETPETKAAGAYLAGQLIL